jgi:hypothetical protein
MEDLFTTHQLLYVNWKRLIISLCRLHKEVIIMTLPTKVKVMLFKLIYKHLITGKSALYYKGLTTPHSFAGLKSYYKIGR